MEKISEIELFNGNIAIIKDTENYKALKSEDYNFFFNKKDGFFVRWGKGQPTNKTSVTKQETDLYVLWCNIWKEKFEIKQFIGDLETDANINNGLPELADIEVSTSCHGVSISGKKAVPCSFCYKSNHPRKNGDGNMSLETFKKVFEKITQIPTIGQIAFGITDIDANPDIWDIFEYTKNNGIVPNVTINGDRMISEYFDNIVKYCGACSVSFYDKDLTYNAIKELTDRGMDQVNIHYMIASETFDNAIKLIDDYKIDPRLNNLNAIVFLSLKPKGKNNNYTRLSDIKFKELVNYALENECPIGFDSCSQPKFIKSVQERSNFKELEMCAESCESSCYSFYINSGEIGENGISDPKFYPCSFSEKVKDAPGNWEEGISIINTDNFIKEVWFNNKVRCFHDVTVDNKNKCIACPMYNI